jgi:hypothetical protein
MSSGCIFRLGKIIRIILPVRQPGVHHLLEVKETAVLPFLTPQIYTMRDAIGSSSLVSKLNLGSTPSPVSSAFQVLFYRV